jgi:hypothetical protein
MKFKEERALANIDNTIKMLLELANAGEPDHAGLIHVAPVNTEFRATCGDYFEYGAAMKESINA